MKQSNYNIVARNDSVYLIYNTLNTQYIAMSPNSFADFSNEITLNINELKQLGFIINDNEDESSKIKEKLCTIQNSRILDLVLIPTLNCNFCCSYCYEQHIASKIDKNILFALKKYVESSIDEYDAMNISWFGGEPLLQMDTLCTFSREMNQLFLAKRKAFFASVVTNGYLLDEVNFDKLYRCRVRSIMVTLDGIEPDHNRRRALKGNLPTYNKIIDNLINIKKRDGLFSILIRMNIDQDNIKNIDQFIDDMYDLFGDDKRFDMLLYMTCDWGQNKDASKPNSKLIKSNDLIYETISKHCNQFKFDQNFRSIENLNCKFFNRNSYVINYTGDISKCTINLENPALLVGKLNCKNHIFNKNKDKLDRMTYWENAECLHCKMIPICNGVRCLDKQNKNQKKCSFTIEKLEKVLIAKYECDKSSFKHIGE